MLLNKKTLGTLLSFLMITACAHAQPEKDPYEWLEEVESPKALEWVKDRNDKTLKDLQGDTTFKDTHEALEKILLAKDRIPSAVFREGYFYNFWQDEKNPKGLWRRTTLEEYRKASPAWEVLLDIDALSKEEGKDWVWKGADYLHSNPDVRILNLSDGGKDAVVIREYNIKDKKFVARGFELPLAKTNVSLYTPDQLLVATDFGPGSMTKSGYARIIKLWKRGTPLDQAITLFEAKEEDMMAGASFVEDPEGNYTIISRAIDFYHSEKFILQKDLTLQKLPIPDSSEFLGFFHDQMLVQLRDELSTAKFGIIPKGSVVAAPKDTADLFKDAEPVFTPNDKTTVQGVSMRKDDLLISLLENVQGKILSVSKKNGAWKTEDLNFPQNGVLSLYSASRFSKEIMVTFESFTLPTTYYFESYDGFDKPTREAIKAAPARFDASNIEVEQHFSTSKDGTKIPYFLVKKKGMSLDGKNPTLLYGYGGFEIPMLPSYRAAMGKVWLERGGVFALANIRGGGEFGPAWHQAALKHNRQLAFDDFISVGDDLVSRKVTSPRHLGIMGGSNGGLLMGAAMTQRPDLFNAVVIQVPLLDMMRFHKLLAGNSWMGEYGNPDLPEDCAVILKYSPYQKLDKATQYPHAFFVTSTFDDRVHPGHARKMAAKMEEFGKTFSYFENMTGGHAASTTPSEVAFRNALEYTFLWRMLK